MTKLGAAIDLLKAAPDQSAVLANATAFLSGFGHIVLGWIWLGWP